MEHRPRSSAAALSSGSSGPTDIAEGEMGDETGTEQAQADHFAAQESY